MFVREGEGLRLVFRDLAVDGRLAEAAKTRYVYTLSYKKRGLHQQSFTEAPDITISQEGKGFVDNLLSSEKFKRETDKIFSVSIQTQREGGPPTKTVEVYFYYPGSGREPRVVGVVREE